MASRRTGTRPTTDVRVSALVPIPLGSGGIARFARALVRAERRALAALSITFVGPARMRALNRAMLGRDRVTDVIAMTLDAPTRRRADAQVVGDIYICPAVAAREAKAAGTSLKDELRRLVAHGILHVLGYDHPRAAARRVRSPMWRRQERYVARLGALAR